MPIPPTKYSVELPNTRKPGQTGIYRNVLYPDTLTVTTRKEVTTLYENFQVALKVSKDRNCIGHRPYNKQTGQYGSYQWQTYKQVADRIENFGSGILHLNENVIKNPKFDQWAVGIYANNRPEWFITDQANCAYNLITVALYDTLGPDTVEYVINHAEISIAVVGVNRIPGLIQLTSKIPNLKVIISMDELDDDLPIPIGGTTSGKVLKAWAEDKGLTLLSFSEVEKLGKNNPRKHNPPSPNNIACICYTSGTTGVPKGALLTHANFIAASSSITQIFEGGQDDVLISYLPLAHIFGRTVETTAVGYGCSIGYFHGDILSLIDDLAELKPTLFPSVPRLLTRIYAKLQQATVEAPGIKGALSRKAVAAKLERLEGGQGYTHPLWDRLIFNKIKQVLGGRVRLVITGSAPIDASVLQFLRIAFATEIIEGYGQTEGVANATIGFPGENKAGHVGGPQPCCEIKLVDVPEMKYLSTDKPYPRGEFCYRGKNCFIGFYKDEEKTRESIDSDGWVHSGDISYIDDRGAITIIDRKKNIFKLSQGEYVAPEKIENVYLNSKFVLQLFVHGDSLRNFLVAIVVPDPETFVPWANVITGKNISLGDEDGLKVLINDPKVCKEFLKEMDNTGKRAKLRGLKLKRHEAQTVFRKVIDDLYIKAESNTSNTKAKL
ncbi:8706_t:CDS:10 [Funneliformis caledonium]|uniref:8706_t:CDS:1 n=1 Tax=Funneliformis caledonium TaxID=1117310 RepID=A0A9N9BHD4_9GLOM|nr:8706_t:CDS:10 [Funneliformis caledonium]